MSLPKEPRQLMINLMYLVLTAMLALNVSSEILNAFKTINQSITSSNTSITQKNEAIYNSFEQQSREEATKERFAPYNEKAKLVRAQAEAMIKYLDEWKEKIIVASGGREEDGEIKRQDDIDASTRLMVEGKGGDEIKQKLTQLRNNFLSVIKPEARPQYETDLPIKLLNTTKSDNNPRGDWATGNFYNMPTMAVVTLLSKFQNDVKNSEAMILNQLSAEVGDEVIKFDDFIALAVPSNTYVLAGQKVEAKISVAAYNRSMNPIVSVNSGRVTGVENGVATWETSAAGTGLQTVRGTVSVNMGNMGIIKKEFDFEYMVGSTGASMQLDKMNVFYIGVPNPITVTAAGYSLEDVSVSIPGATVTAGANKGQYNVTVTNPGEVNAVINARTPQGPKSVGSQKIRIKFIPDPVATVGGKSSGMMPANQFRAQLGIIAQLVNFDFDARFVVTSYQFGMAPKGKEYIGPYTVNSNRFDGDANVTAAMARAKPGDKIFIEEIKARGPDGRNRTINNIILTLN